jgi:serine/threonine protein kinase/WD40 repeat protein
VKTIVPRTRELFLHALNHIPLEERSAFLQSECGDDPGLQAEIEQLLQAYDRAGGFMEMPAADHLDLLVSSDQRVIDELQPGHLIDRYVLLSVIGRGGMGTVFKARQLMPVERIVAFKVIAAGTQNPLTLALFEAERQTLASLKHHGIVSVLDAGMTDCGRPYFVMEYLDGLPLTQFCEQHPLSIQDRLRLLIDVCDAVQHAHFRGILHCDLKPANILICILDGRPVTRVIDFGVQQTFTRSESESRVPSGSERAGTPAYMSPEQACGDASKIDSRSDVYSLGVLLYELLTGTTPIPKDQFRDMNRWQTIENAFSQLRIPSPSERGLLTTDRLTRTQRRELDAICARALMKDPEHRFATPRNLAEDLQHFLDDSTVLAVGNARSYLLQKFIRRYRPLLLLCLLTVVSILAGLVVSLAQTSRVERALANADRYLKQSLAEKRRYQELAWQSRIQQAYRFWEGQRYFDANRLLDELAGMEPQADQKPEWKMLRSELAEVWTVKDRASLPIREALSFPDTIHVAVAGEDGLIRILNSESGETSGTIATGLPSIHAMTISRSGDRIAVGGGTDPVSDLAVARVFNVADGRLLVEFPGLPTTIESLEFAGEGRYLICGARYENVIVFDAQNATAVTTLPTQRRHRWFAVSQQGNRLAVEESVNSVLVVDLTHDLKLRTLPVPERLISALWFEPGDRLITVLKSHREIIVFDPLRNQILARLQGPSDANEVLYSKHRQSLFACTDLGEVWQWEFSESLVALPALSETAVPKTIPEADDPGSRDRVPSIMPAGRWQLTDTPLLTFCETAHSLVAGDFQGRVLELPFRAKPPQETAVVSEIEGRPPNDVTCLAVDQKNSQLFTGDPHGRICEMNFPETPDGSTGSPPVPAIRRIIQTGNELINNTTAIAVSPDGGTLAWIETGTEQIAVCDRRTLKQTRFPSRTDSTSTINLDVIRFSPDSTTMAWTGDREFLCLDPDKGWNSLVRAELPGHGTCIGWSADATQALVGGEFSALYRVEIASGQRSTAANPGIDATTIRFTADGERVITGHTDGSLRLWAWENDRLHLIYSIPSGEAAAVAIAISPDQRIGYSLDRNSGVFLWFVDSGKRIGELAAVSAPGNFRTAARGDCVFDDQGASFLAAVHFSESSLALRRWRLHSGHDAVTTY